MVTWQAYLCGVIGLERLFELWLSARHAKRAFARGGLEVGRGHWLPMRLLHTGLLLGAWLEPACIAHRQVSWHVPVGCALLAVSQALRYWAVSALGTAWNVRVIVVPGSVAKRGGPYRWLRHPNYVAVVLEGLALPFACGAYFTLALFFGLNAWLLRVRIACEEQALHSHAKGYGLVAS